MIVRIRFGKGPTIQRERRKNRHVALAVAALLTPAAVMAFVLACWRLAADFQAANQFPIDNGLFSHWQIWLACAALLQLASFALNRYGKEEPSSVNS
jgi:hypothetical protein